VLVALVESIATTAGVSNEQVAVTRQMQAIVGQDGIEHICEVNYVIIVPPAEPAFVLSESNRIKAAFGLTKEETDQNIEQVNAKFVTKVDQAVGSGVYSIRIESISIPEVQTELVPPPPPPNTGKDEDKDGASTGVIGGVIGAGSVLLIFACCVIVCCYVRRRRPSA